MDKLTFVRADKLSRPPRPAWRLPVELLALDADQVLESTPRAEASRTTQTRPAQARVRSARALFDHLTMRPPSTNNEISASGTMMPQRTTRTCDSDPERVSWGSDIGPRGDNELRHMFTQVQISGR